MAAGLRWAEGDSEEVAVEVEALEVLVEEVSEEAAPRANGDPQIAQITKMGRSATTFFKGSRNPRNLWPKREGKWKSC